VGIHEAAPLIAAQLGEIFGLAPRPSSLSELEEALAPHQNQQVETTA
jgi:hypothetical protein